MKILSILAKIIYNQKNGSFRKSLIFPILGIIIGSYVIFMTLSIMNGMEKSIVDRIKSFDYPYYIYEKNIDNSFVFENNGYESIGIIENNNLENLVYVKSYENLQDYIDRINQYLLIDKKNKVDSDIYIGYELSRQLNLNVGDSLKLSSPLSANIATKIFPSKMFNIGGIYEMSMFDYDSKFIICSNDAFVDLYGDSAGNKKYYVSQKNNFKDELIFSNDNEMLISALQFERNIYVFFGFSVIFFSSFILMIVMMITALEKRTQFSIINILGLSIRKIQLAIFLNNLISGLLLSIFGYMLAIITINLNYSYNVFNYIFNALPFQNIPMSLTYSDILVFLLMLILIVSVSGILPFIFKIKNILVVKSE